MKDTKEFEEYKKSDSFITHKTVPKKIKEITLTDYVNNFASNPYFQESLAFINSPLTYLFSKLKPFLNQNGFVTRDLTRGGYEFNYLGLEIQVGAPPIDRLEEHRRMLGFSSYPKYKL